MASYRLLRLASRIKFLVSSVIQREIQDPRMGMVTVLDVELTSDVKEARIFISIFGEPGTRSKTLHALEGARGFIQKEVGRNLETRNTPRLNFLLRENQDKVSRIEALMQEVQEDQEVAMAKKPGKKDAKSQKGTGPKPSKSAKKPAKSEKKAVEKGRKGEEAGEAKAKSPKAPAESSSKKPPRGFDDEPEVEKDFEVEDLGEEEKDYLEDIEEEEEDFEEEEGAEEDEDEEKEEEEEEEEDY